MPAASWSGSSPTPATARARRSRFHATEGLSCEASPAPCDESAKGTPAPAAQHHGVGRSAKNSQRSSAMPARPRGSAAGQHAGHSVAGSASSVELARAQPEREGQPAELARACGRSRSPSRSAGSWSGCAAARPSAPARDGQARSLSGVPSGFPAGLRPPRGLEPKSEHGRQRGEAARPRAPGRTARATGAAATLRSSARRRGRPAQSAADATRDRLQRGVDHAGAPDGGQRAERREPAPDQPEGVGLGKIQPMPRISAGRKGQAARHAPSRDSQDERHWLTARQAARDGRDAGSRTKAYADQRQRQSRRAELNRESGSRAEAPQPEQEQRP